MFTESVDERGKLDFDHRIYVNRSRIVEEKMSAVAESSPTLQNVIDEIVSYGL